MSQVAFAGVAGVNCAEVTAVGVNRPTLPACGAHGSTGHEHYSNDFKMCARSPADVGNRLSSLYTLGKSPLRIRVERVQSRDYRVSTSFRYLSFATTPSPRGSACAAARAVAG